MIAHSINGNDTNACSSASTFCVGERAVGYDAVIPCSEYLLYCLPAKQQNSAAHIKNSGTVIIINSARLAVFT